MEQSVLRREELLSTNLTDHSLIELMKCWRLKIRGDMLTLGQGSVVTALPQKSREWLHISTL